MSKRVYIAALKRAQAEAAPSDWQEQLSQLDGVSVVGSTAKRIQFTADPETIEKLRAEHGDYLNLEEAADRQPL